MIKNGTGSILKVIIVLSLIIFSIYGCTKENIEAAPILTAISPSSKAINMPGFTLKVTGAGFTEYSKIYFNDIGKETIFISETELTCTISSESIESDSGIDHPLLEDKGTLSDIPVFVSDGGRNFSEKLYFRVRENNAFAISVSITDSNFASYNPSIAIDENDHLFIVYERYDNNSEHHVTIIRSVDGGAGWSQPVNIFTSNEKISNPSISTFGNGNIYVTFSNKGLFFSSSNDAGRTWSSPQRISYETPYKIESEIQADTEGDLYLLWVLPSSSADTAVYYQRSLDGGNTFSPAVNISSEKDNFSSVYNPAFTVKGNYIYAAWAAWPLWDSRYGHVYFNSSKNLGQTWSDVDGSFGVCSSADFSTGGNNEVYIVLSSSHMPFENQIVFYRSPGESVNWGSRIEITSNSNDTYPDIKTDTVGNINIIFKNSSGCYYVRSIDGGDTWTDPLFVSDKISFIYRKKLIDMAIDTGGNIYIISEFDSSGVLYFTKSY